MGWIQENVFSQFSFAEPLEGLGFGALQHFWGTSGPNLYELGGGHLQDFVE